MGEGGEAVYRRALERGGLTPAQRRLAQRRLRLQRAAAQVGDGRTVRALPLLARVALENPGLWRGWLRRAR